MTDALCGRDTKQKFCLRNFDISEKTGFLPEIPPLMKLPGDYFTEWEDLVEHMPQLIRDKQVRDKIDHLPEVEFSINTLKSEAEWMRAYTMLTFLGQAYIWMEGNPEQPLKQLPHKIAVPWNAVSKHIGMQPVLTYASAVLYNYSLRDPSKPLAVDNLQAISTFFDKPDESWFYMVHVNVEFAAAPGLKAIEHAYSSMAEKQNDALAQDLQQITAVLGEMAAVVKRMYEGCQPDFF